MWKYTTCSFTLEAAWHIYRESNMCHLQQRDHLYNKMPDKAHRQDVQLAICRAFKDIKCINAFKPFYCFFLQSVIFRQLFVCRGFTHFDHPLLYTSKGGKTLSPNMSSNKHSYNPPSKPLQAPFTTQQILLRCSCVTSADVKWRMSNNLLFCILF